MYSYVYNQRLNKDTTDVEQNRRFRISTLVKSGGRSVKYILLCSWCWLAPYGDSMPERRGVGNDTPESSWGKVIYALLYVGLSELGKTLDKGYLCPDYCGVDHKHNYEIKESYIQAVDGLHIATRDTTKEQSAVGI